MSRFAPAYSGPTAFDRFWEPLLVATAALLVLLGTL